MTFQQLLYLTEISCCGSINKAAQKLCLSQSNISSAVKELEKELNIRFFIRSNRGVEFTPEGQHFLTYAASLLEQKQYLEDIYKKQNVSAPVQFSVSAQHYPFTEETFVRLLQRTNSTQYLFRLKETSMNTVIEDVFTHSADLGVIMISGFMEKIILHLLHSKSITFQKILDVQPCAYVRREHPLARQKSVTISDLTAYPYMTFEQDEEMTMDFSQEIHLRSTGKPSRLVNVNDRATAINVIVNTDTVTSSSGLLVQALADPRIVALALEGYGSMRLGWIKLKGKKLSLEAANFISLLERSVTEALDYTSKKCPHWQQ